MLSDSFLRRTVVRSVIGIFALYAQASFSQAAEITPEKLDKAAKIYAELRRQSPQLEPRSAERVAADFDAVVRAKRAAMPDLSNVTVRAVSGSVAASARCKEGYVRTGSYRAGDQGVRLVSENRSDCDARGCRAYEVTVANDSGKPFDLTVSVTCS